MPLRKGHGDCPPQTGVDLEPANLAGFLRRLEKCNDRAKRPSSGSPTSDFSYSGPARITCTIRVARPEERRAWRTRKPRPSLRSHDVPPRLCFAQVTLSRALGPRKTRKPRTVGKRPERSRRSAGAGLRTTNHTNRKRGANRGLIRVTGGLSSLVCVTPGSSERRIEKAAMLRGARTVLVPTGK